MAPLICLLILSSCSVEPPAVSEESAGSREISIAESSEVPASVSSMTPSAPDKPESPIPETRNMNIYGELQDLPHTNVLIAVDEHGNASIMESGLSSEVAFQNGYLVGCVSADPQSMIGSQLASLDLVTGEIYESGLQIWTSNIHFFENDVIALIGGYAHTNSDSINKRQPLLMDHHCNPLPTQLQFDFGATSKYGGDEYIIAAIAYRPGNDNYVAVFSKNPYYGDPYGDFDNTVCELGIAVFDGTGRQLERFSLDGVLHPLNTSGMKNYAKLPLLYLLDDETALIVPQEGVNSARISSSKWEPLESYSIAPVIINLNDHSFTRWSEEEMQSFLAGSSTLEGKMEEIFRYWNVKPKPQATSFRFVKEDDILFVFQDGNENDLPLFALPKLRTPRRFNLKLYCEWNGIHYMLFSSDRYS